MSSSKMYDKVFAIFGTFMVFFYFALGLFIIFSHYLDDFTNLSKALRIVFGIPLIIYGIYRMLDSYEKIKKSFFSKDDDEE
jgi:threonine/homoserine/homoserine lactone efflux protein